MTYVRAIVGLLLAAIAAVAFAGASSAGNSGSSPRSGELHVTKECSDYHGQAGEFCTITSSTIPQIEPGMRVVYASPAGATSLNSDLILDGPGNNDASGHVTLDFLTLSGVVTFSGGTGRFSGFEASVIVTYDPSTNLWDWDGPYSFEPPGR
jgi:hypothetical protein